MPDREHFTAELKAEYDAPFPILTDFDNGYALSLNLAFWVGEQMQDLMSSAGWDVSRSQGSDTWLLPVPATFVVGTDGEVKARFVDPDYRKRMTIEDLLSTLKKRVLGGKPRPIVGAQHLHHGRGDRCALPAGNAVEMDGASDLDAIHGNAHKAGGAFACCAARAPRRAPLPTGKSGLRLCSPDGNRATSNSRSRRRSSNSSVVSQ